MVVHGACCYLPTVLFYTDYIFIYKSTPIYYVVFFDFVYSMPKLLIDSSTLRAVPLHLSTTRLTRHLDISLPELTALHHSNPPSSSNSSALLTNLIHYEGIPLVYTYLNRIDGFLGKRAQLAFAPTSLTGKAVTGAMVAGSVLGSVTYDLVPKLTFAPTSLTG